MDECTYIVGVHWDTAIRNNMKLNNGRVGMGLDAQPMAIS